MRAVTCQVKITFLLLVLLAFIQRKARNVIITLPGAGASFFLFTFPIIHSYGRFFDWFKNLLIKDGIYGGGDVGLPTFEQISANAIQLLLAEPAFFNLFSLSLMICGLLFFKSRRTPDANNQLRILVILNLIFLGQTHVTIKHSGVHYLAPSPGISAFFVLYSLDGFYPALQKGAAVIVYSGVRIWIAAALVFTPVSLVYSGNQVRAYHAEAQEINRIAAKKYPGCEQAEYYRSSSPEYALTFGYSFIPPRFRETFVQGYPDAISYDKWTHKFFHFDRQLTLEEIQEVLTEVTVCCCPGASSIRIGKRDSAGIDRTSYKRGAIYRLPGVVNKRCGITIKPVFAYSQDLTQGSHDNSFLFAAW